MNPSRRSVLTGAALGLTAACTPSHPAPPAVTSADDRKRAEAAIREEALIQLYAAAIATFPTLAALEPLRTDHVAHRTALGVSAPVVATAAPALVGRTAAEARQRLAALETSVAADHGAAALTATRALAPLLASLAACESTHAAVL